VFLSTISPVTTDSTKEHIQTCYHDVTGLIVLNTFRPHHHDVTGLIVLRNTFRHVINHDNRSECVP
jgi:hypothetical protein